VITGRDGTKWTKDKLPTNKATIKGASKRNRINQLMKLFPRNKQNLKRDFRRNPNSKQIPNMTVKYSNERNGVLFQFAWTFKHHPKVKVRNSASIR